MSDLPLRLAVAFVAMCVASIVAAASVILTGVVCYGALREATTPAIAGLITAFGGMLVAFLLMSGARALIERGRTTSRQPETKSTSTPDGMSTQDKMIAEFGGLIGAELATLIRTRPRETAAGSLAAGFALGASPRLRGFLRNLL